MGSVQGSGIQTGGWRAFLDEVSQDLEDLRGVGDHGDDLHGLVTTRAARGAPAGWRLLPPGRSASQILLIRRAQPLAVSCETAVGHGAARLCLADTDSSGFGSSGGPMRRDGWGGWASFQLSGARRTRWGWRDHPLGAQARALAVPSVRLPPETCRAGRPAGTRRVQPVAAHGVTMSSSLFHPNIRAIA